MSEHLLLKWGTLKGWKFESDTTKALMEKYISIGASASAMLQEDTPEQKAIICDIIRAVNGPITNDWSGKTMTVDQAVKYVMEYGR